MQNPRSLLPHRVPSSTSTRSYKSNLSRGVSLPPASPRLVFDIDSQKYESVMRALLFPIAETRSQTHSPPQRLIQDVKSLLLKSRHSKKNKARVAEAVKVLVMHAQGHKSTKPPSGRKASTMSQICIPTLRKP